MKDDTSSTWKVTKWVQQNLMLDGSGHLLVVYLAIGQTPSQKPVCSGVIL
jgi:hypothetical protein